MSTTTAPRTNRYAGPCHRCHTNVPAETGLLVRGVVQGKWRVEHTTCPAPAPAVLAEATVTVPGRHAHPYDRQRETGGDLDGAWYAPRHRREEDAPAATPQAPTGDAAEGYYVRGDEAFRVVTNKSGTHTYAKRLRVYGDRMVWEYAPGTGRDLAAEGLTPMTAEEAGRLGLLHGRCINCCRPLGGATLSAQVSALIGYGETCASNNGWAYPTGAAAQRAYIATH